MKSLLLALALSACASAPAHVAAPVNRADILLTAEQPDSPHGPVGAHLALMVFTDQKTLMACYSTDDKHTTCFDPVEEYMKRIAAQANAERQKQADAQAKAKADAEAAEKAKAAEATKKK